MTLSDTQKTKVSCVMVTMATPERFHLFKRSVDCYLNQTYINKELVVVLDPRHSDGFKPLKDYVASLRRADIRVIVPKSNTRVSLGRLRNFSMSEARGEVLCQWDDDDVYHPERLKKQYSTLRTKKVGAVYLQEVLHFFSTTKEMYWIDWKHWHLKCHAATGMFINRDLPKYPETGEFSNKGEDTDFLTQLGESRKVFHLAGLPHLYIYTFHGKNTWNASHHSSLAKSYSMPLKSVLKRERAWKSLLKGFFETESPILRGRPTNFIIESTRGSNTKTTGVSANLLSNAPRSGQVSKFIDREKLKILQLVRRANGISAHALASGLNFPKAMIRQEVLEMLDQGLLIRDPRCENPQNPRLFCEWAGIEFKL